MKNLYLVKKENMVSAKQIFKELKYPHVVIGMFVTTMIIQASNNSISPIISLYIRQLLNGHGSVTLISGIIASIPRNCHFDRRSTIWSLR